MGALVPVIAALAGSIVGSALTAVLLNLATIRRELRQSRIAVLVALIRGRSDIFSDEVAGNVNVIPILFYDQRAVRGAYQDFCALPNGPSIDVNRRYDALVLALAASLNFKELSAADIDLGYYPMPPIRPDRSRV